MVLADLAKVHAIHWKMLTGARVETPEDEAVFSMMVPSPLVIKMISMIRRKHQRKIMGEAEVQVDTVNERVEFLADVKTKLQLKY